MRVRERQIFLFLISIIAIISMNTFAGIQGQDDREFSDQLLNYRWEQKARSVVAIIHKKHINNNGRYSKILATSKFRRPCPRMKHLKNSPTVADCSGVLVAPDLVLTAGHCLEKRKCGKYRFVFGYRSSNIDKNQNAVTVKSSRVYRCKRIVEYASGGYVNKKKTTDYALVELTRPVSKSIKPLKIEMSDDLKKGENLVLIGHPYGLPSMISNIGIVRKNELINLFKHNLDTLGGSSGAPIFNDQTGRIEGIHNSGFKSQFYYEAGQKCWYRHVHPYISKTYVGTATKASIVPGIKNYISESFLINGR